MIRRELRLPTGAPAWALISQIDHARLSGQLAGQLSSLPGNDDDRRQVLGAIRRHDDGWAPYDVQPHLDDRGRPRSFMEMQLDDSLSIWNASIDQAVSIGPLAAWLVAGHFMRLLGGSERLAEESPAARWQVEMADRREPWFAQWGGTHETARVALDWLQVLDAVSLWICGDCPAAGDRDAGPEAPYETATPAGDPITWRAKRPGQLTATAGPLRAGRLALEAAGSVVPAARYDSPGALIAAATPRVFRWELLVAG